VEVNDTVSEAVLVQEFEPARAMPPAVVRPV